MAVRPIAADWMKAVSSPVSARNRKDSPSAARINAAMAMLREPAEINLDARIMRGWVLSNLGNRLADLGRPQDALNAADEAVRIYRDLVARASPATAWFSIW
jgi:hypothetical protein